MVPSYLRDQVNHDQSDSGRLNSSATGPGCGVRTPGADTARRCGRQRNVGVVARSGSRLPSDLTDLADVTGLTGAFADATAQAAIVWRRALSRVEAVNPAVMLAGDGEPMSLHHDADLAGQEALSEGDAIMAAATGKGRSMDHQSWTITRAEAGPDRPRPKRWAPPGTVVRAELWEDEQRPFPTDMPGYRRIDEHRISAIVTTVSEDPPVYCRDEDGDQPTELIGEDGWFFNIHVRPATAEKALSPFPLGS